MEIIQTSRIFHTFPSWFCEMWSICDAFCKKFHESFWTFEGRFCMQKKDDGRNLSRIYVGENNLNL